LVTGGHAEPEADVVFVAVKYYHTHSLLDALRPIAGTGIPIISLQNGFAGLELLKDNLPNGRFLQAATEMGARLLGDGLVVEEARGNTFLCGDSAEVSLVAQMLEPTGIRVIAGSGGCEGVWRKFALICSVATTSALLGLTVGDVISNEVARELTLDLATEVSALAQVLGARCPEDEVKAYVLRVSEGARNHVPSLLADVLTGRPTEAAALCGYVARKSQELGLQATLSSTAYRLLRAMEASYTHRILPTVGRKLSLL
jgi:2-dehydropantoate 2-reductase